MPIWPDMVRRLCVVETADGVEVCGCRLTASHALTVSPGPPAAGRETLTQSSQPFGITFRMTTWPETRVLLGLAPFGWPREVERVILRGVPCEPLWSTPTTAGPHIVLLRSLKPGAEESDPIGFARATVGSAVTAVSLSSGGGVNRFAGRVQSVRRGLLEVALEPRPGAFVSAGAPVFGDYGLIGMVLETTPAAGIVEMYPVEKLAERHRFCSALPVPVMVARGDHPSFPPLIEQRHAVAWAAGAAALLVGFTALSLATKLTPKSQPTSFEAPILNPKQQPQPPQGLQQQQQPQQQQQQQQLQQQFFKLPLPKANAPLPKPAQQPRAAAQ